MDLSTCCKKEVAVISGNEGTSFYVCLGCREACDVKPTTKKGEMKMDELSEKDRNFVEKTFVYYAPKNDHAQRYERLRAEAKSLAELICKSCPESREKSLALTNLQQTVMWANASIAINE